MSQLLPGFSRGHGSEINADVAQGKQVSNMMPNKIISNAKIQSF
jgi:hypothetical protein